jgi:hypothetical protein
LTEISVDVKRFPNSQSLMEIHERVRGVSLGG